MAKYKLLTHNADLDGIGCAVLAKAFFKNDCELELCGYNDFEEKLEETLKNPPEFLLITDLSPSEQGREKLLNYPGQKLLIDHHFTSLPLAEENWARINTSYCATMGLFLHLGGTATLPEYEEFVRLVNDRDLWLKQDSRADELAYLLNAIGPQDFIDRFSRNPSVELTKEEAVIVNAIIRRIEKTIEDTEIFEFYDKTTDAHGGMVFLNDYASDVAHIILQKNPELDYLMVVKIRKRHLSISLRTQKDTINLAELAQRYGGGGHPKAAGFVMQADFFVDELLKQLGLEKAKKKIQIPRGYNIPEIPREIAEEITQKHKFWKASI